MEDMVFTNQENLLDFYTYNFPSVAYPLKISNKLREIGCESKTTCIDTFS